MRCRRGLHEPRSAAQRCPVTHLCRNQALGPRSHALRLSGPPPSTGWVVGAKLQEATTGGSPQAARTRKEMLADLAGGPCGPCRACRTRDARPAAGGWPVNRSDHRSSNGLYSRKLSSGSTFARRAGAPRDAIGDGSGSQSRQRTKSVLRACSGSSCRTTALQRRGLSPTAPSMWVVRGGRWPSSSSRSGTCRLPR